MFVIIWTINYFTIINLKVSSNYYSILKSYLTKFVHFVHDERFELTQQHFGLEVSRMPLNCKMLIIYLSLIAIDLTSESLLLSLNFFIYFFLKLVYLAEGALTLVAEFLIDLSSFKIIFSNFAIRKVNQHRGGKIKDILSNLKPKYYMGYLWVDIAWVDDLIAVLGLFKLLPHNLCLNSILIKYLSSNLHK